MLIQSKYSQLMRDLSWSKVGQSIVDGVGQLLDLDLAILHIHKLDRDAQQHFFYQKLNADSPIDRDLLKLTVTPKSKFTSSNEIVIDRYQTGAIFSSQADLVCLPNGIVASTSTPLYLQTDLFATLTIHHLQDGDCLQPQQLEILKTLIAQGEMLFAQMFAKEKLREQAQRETTINRIATAIRSSLNPPIMFATIVQELGTALQVDGCTLSLWTQSDRFVRCVGLYNPHEEQKIILDSDDGQLATTSQRSDCGEPNSSGSTI